VVVRSIHHLGTTRAAAAGIAALCACCAYAGPQSVRATYNGYLNGMHAGVITEEYEAEGGNYRLVSQTRTTGLATILNREPLRFSSTGELTAAGLRPIQFEARRNAGEPAQIAASFDWPQGQLTLRHAGKTESVPLPPGTQDRLSAMYQLLFLPLDRMRSIDFAMTNGRKLDQYHYSVTPDVELNTPIGRLKTLYLVKERREPGESSAELWVSAQHHHFPVRLVTVQRNGLRFEQMIQTLDIRE